MLNWKTWTRRLLMPLCALTCATAGAGEPANPPAADAQAAHIQAVAEDAYIYGLPIVMNYAVMYDFSINAASPQFKAPWVA